MSCSQSKRLAFSPHPYIKLFVFECPRMAGERVLDRLGRLGRLEQELLWKENTFGVHTSNIHFLCRLERACRRFRIIYEWKISETPHRTWSRSHASDEAQATSVPQSPIPAFWSMNTGTIWIHPRSAQASMWPARIQNNRGFLRVILCIG